jgi:hypothetical protein
MYATQRTTSTTHGDETWLASARGLEPVK